VLSTTTRNCSPTLLGTFCRPITNISLYTVIPSLLVSAERYAESLISGLSCQYLRAATCLRTAVMYTLSGTCHPWYHASWIMRLRFTAWSKKSEVESKPNTFLAQSVVSRAFPHHSSEGRLVWLLFRNSTMPRFGSRWL